MAKTLTWRAMLSVSGVTETVTGSVLLAMACRLSPLSSSCRKF
jgi:hypothetical protein